MFMLSGTVAILLSTAFILYLLCVRRDRDLSAVALLGGLIAAVALEFFTLQSVMHPDQWFIWCRRSLLTTAFLPICWLLFALTFQRAGGLTRLSLLPRVLLAASAAIPPAILLVPVDFYLRQTVVHGKRVLFLTPPGFLFCIILVIYLTYALMQLERTLVALPRHSRWQGKFEAIGTGTLLTMYIVYFSQGLLYGAVDNSLLPARSLALAAAVALMAFSRLRGGGGTRIQVSPTIAFRSVVVLAVGAYLFLLGLLGEGLRGFDPALQRLLLPVAGLGGGIAIVVVFLSETVRRRIKVSLHKNFYRDKYDYREHWLHFTRRIDAAVSPEELQQAILAIFGEAFAVESTVLYLRDPEREVWRAAAAQGSALPQELFASDSALVRHLATSSWVFSSRDENPPIWRESRPFLDKYQASFIVPLHVERILEGFVLLGPPVNRRENYTYEDFDLMKLLAAQAASVIGGRRLSDQLAAARELAAIGKMSAFVMHDLKNLVSTLALVADNARHSLGDEEFRTDMLLTLNDNVSRMKALIGRLQNLEEKPTLDPQPADLAAVVRAGVRQAGGGEIEISGGPVPAFVDPEEIGKVALNLILNARDAGGQVRVHVGYDHRPFFRVSDSGGGMSEEFIRTRLFRPFETTKKKGFGIGLYQCKHIVEAHGGTIEVSSTPGVGSEFTVWLAAGPGRPGDFVAADRCDPPHLDSYPPPATFHEGILTHKRNPSPPLAGSTASQSPSISAMQG